MTRATNEDQASSKNGPSASKSPAPKKKRRLGRGLSSLLSTPVQIATEKSEESPAVPRGTDRVAAASSAGTTGSSPESTPGRLVSDSPEEGRLLSIRTDSIETNPHQPRTDFNEAALKTLADSIAHSGLMQPIVVRSLKNTPASSPSFELIAGERRLRAMQLLERELIPAVLVEADDRSAAEMALVENLQRADLNPVERANALIGLRDTFGLTQRQIGERVGLERSTIANLIRILDLDDFCLAAVRRGSLTLAHAKSLLSIEDDVLRRTTAAAALSGDWTVRELDRRIQGLVTSNDGNDSGGQVRPITTKRANVMDLERRLAQILGMRVQITLGRKKGTGKLQVEFGSIDQFDQLTDRLGLGAEDA